MRRERNNRLEGSQVLAWAGGSNRPNANRRLRRRVEISSGPI